MAESRSDWESLQSGIAGEVVLPKSPTYDQARKGFNARFDEVRPQAVVRCNSPEDVAESISFARGQGLETVPRSGGHCFAGRSSTEGVVIDVSPLNSVSVSDGVATVGAGVRLGDLYPRLLQEGLAVPSGTCPTVRISGLALGGGLGILGRRYGLTSDHLLSAQIVLADGRVVECDEHHDQDLFWALRGAGSGNFGVVTSLVFRLRPAPDLTTFRLFWEHSHAIEAIKAWMDWGPAAPDEVAASLVLAADTDVDRPPVVDVFGAVQGSESDAEELLGLLVAHVGADPASEFRKLMSYGDTMGYWGQLDHLSAELGEVAPTSKDSEQQFLIAKSEFFNRPLPTDAIAALAENFTKGRASGQYRELDFMAWGGAYSRLAANATAFVHRDPLFLLKHAIMVDPAASTGEKEAAHRWATQSWALVHRWGTGRVFPNFPDPDLEDWAGAYYGTNLDRLLRIKARFDPENLFRSRQSLLVH